jgi:hypothetical protein
MIDASSRFRAVLGLRYGIAFSLETPAEQRPNPWLVIDDKNVTTHEAMPLSAGRMTTFRFTVAAGFML